MWIKRVYVKELANAKIYSELVWKKNNNQTLFKGTEAWETDRNCQYKGTCKPSTYPK